MHINYNNLITLADNNVIKIIAINAKKAIPSIYTRIKRKNISKTLEYIRKILIILVNIYKNTQN